MSGLLVISHTYVEPENRGKLRALAASGPVTVVIPKHWEEKALRRSWTHSGSTTDAGVTVVAASRVGPMHPSRGLLLIPRSAIDAADIVQLEAEPWTPTARVTVARAAHQPMFLFTWENLHRTIPPPWSWWRRAVFKRIDGLIGGSSGAIDVARAQGFRGPAAVIPQLGVDVPPRAPRAPGPFTIAFVGRLVPGKGVDILLHAAKGLPAGTKIEIIGDGPERSSLEHLAAELALEAVHFAGARPHAEVAAIWRTADVLVLPSRSTPGWKEQLGHVLLEAMAHEVAVVGADSGAIPDVIGDAGVVVAEDDHHALHRALNDLVQNPSRCRELAVKGRRRAEALYTNERIAERTRAFHQEVLDSMRSAR